jgi:hypothetical protein
LIREDRSVINEGDIQSRTALEIARGNYPGAEIVSAHGKLIATGGRIDNLIWPIENTLRVPVPDEAGERMTIYSESDNDTLGGTGINSVGVSYLDVNLDQKYAVINMNGTSGAEMPEDSRFIQCMHGVSFGSLYKADADITAQAGSPAVVYSKILAGKNRCSSGTRRVPRGKNMFIAAMAASSTSATADTTSSIEIASTCLFEADLAEEGVLFPHMSVGMQNGGEGLSGLAFPFPPGCIVGFIGSCNKSATLHATFIGWTENV